MCPLSVFFIIENLLAFEAIYQFFVIVQINELKNRIEDGLPGSDVEILDPRRDGVHLQANVIYGGFEGKTLLEQHRMVYKLLEEELKGELHALALQTRSS